VRRSKTERSWTDWIVGSEPAQSAAAAFPISLFRQHSIVIIIGSNAAQTAKDLIVFTNSRKTK